MFTNQLSTCAEDAENPNWLTSRVAGIPLDWTPPDVYWSDAKIVDVLKDGTEVNFDNKAFRKLSRDVNRMAKKISKKARLE